MTRYAIQAEGLVQRYGRRHVVFDGLDIRVPDGVTGLLGPNGAGKSTLMDMVCTLRPPAGGQLRVLESDPATRLGRREIRRQLGYLPQSFGYMPYFTVREFVGYAAWLKRVNRVAAPLLVTEALEAVDLQDVAERQLKTLSGGMLRRAGIAQAIVHRPRLLVLDEPTAGLDPQQRIELRRVLRGVAERASVLMSTHLVEDVRTTCGHLVVLQAGRVVFTGSPGQLAAAEVDTAAGDSDLERGYSSVLAPAGGG